MPQPSRTYRYLAQVTSPSDPSDGLPGASNLDRSPGPAIADLPASPAALDSAAAVRSIELGTSCRGSWSPLRVVLLALGNRTVMPLSHRQSRPLDRVQSRPELSADTADEKQSGIFAGCVSPVDARNRIGRCSSRAATKPDSPPEIRSPARVGVVVSNITRPGPLGNLNAADAVGHKPQHP